MNSLHSARPIGQPSLASRDYLSHRDIQVLDSRAFGLENWQANLCSLAESDSAPNRIVLIEEPFVLLHPTTERAVFDTLSGLADQGFQLIVTSKRTTLTTFPAARVIQIGRNAYRAVSVDPTRLPEGPTLLSWRFRLRGPLGGRGTVGTSLPEPLAVWRSRGIASCLLRRV
ncbi:hypothetical protein [Kitasatospora purpeofusca]|uniref:hypothetical protein n=1 Tax=Kitasatospora purpeofusca TaxID=67352 RepID=UPI002A5A996E|nr:hypothetical protein [Kitasatospora purpeofusca]MDY0812036.1 hypothetical protein [Kitasatospora purpeofusca]